MDNPLNTQAPHPHKALIQAYLNGETIQVKIREGQWADLDALNTRLCMPSFFNSSVYRKKPVKKEGWVNIYKEHSCVYPGGVYNSKEEAEKNATTNCFSSCKIEWEE